jgi:hypothetical protein
MVVEVVVCVAVVGVFVVVGVGFVWLAVDAQTSAHTIMILLLQ